jgi:DNA-binding transcriptional MocR family regulator
MTPTTPRKLAEQLPERTARGIAVGIAHLVRSRWLDVGERLPTVRVLAAELGVSPTTVAEAWRLLAEARVIETRGKRGTVIRGEPQPRGQQRMLRSPAIRTYPLDLRLAVPDPALLPDPRAAIATMPAVPELNEYPGEATTMVPALRELQEADWPFAPERMMVVNGGYDGVYLLCQSLLRPGDRVIVEDPGTGRLLDVLEAMNVEPVPIDCDAYGPVPDALAEALAARPVALVYQPRAQSPTGSAVDAERIERLAAVLRDTDLAIIEDDPECALSTQPAHSLGTWYPERTVVVRNWSRSHGPDLRLGVMGGGTRLLEPAWAARGMGAEWTSRLLQGALAYMLTDPDTRALVAGAADIYRERRKRLAEALRNKGVETQARDGLVLWVPVRHEHAALVDLAVHGIGAGPGSFFTHRPPRTHHLRVATSRLPEDRVEEVADVLASVAPHTSSRGGSALR